MTGNRKASLYKSRGRFSIAVRYVLERAKGICEDRINVNGTTRHFEGYKYKTLTYPHYAFTRPHEYRFFQPLLRDSEPHNLERGCLTNVRQPHLINHDSGKDNR